MKSGSKASCLDHSRTVGPLMCKEVAGAFLRGRTVTQAWNMDILGLEATLEATHTPHKEGAA